MQFNLYGVTLSAPDGEITLAGGQNITLWPQGRFVTISATIPHQEPWVRRVVAMANAASFTPTADTADINTQTNTQAIGNLTANAPSGTPSDGQQLELRIKSTNVQTFVWNAIYDGGGTTALPTATTGGGATDRFYFEYDAGTSKWCIVNAQYGY